MEAGTVTVLFLEDEPTIREVLAEYMKMSGYLVTETARGDEAIALLQENSYHIAVLDVMVPGVDGFEVLQHIRDHCPETATIMLTALDDEKTQIKAFNLYADDYVIKPVSPIILLKRMETILRRTLYMERKLQAQKSGEENADMGIPRADEEMHTVSLWRWRPQPGKERSLWKEARLRIRPAV